MPSRLPVFAIATDKIARAKTEMMRLATYLDAYDRSGFDDLWSRTATVAFALHAAYTGVEDVMMDIASAIDGYVPQGANWHQALLDQMHVALEGRRSELLNDQLYGDMVELKSFRHLVRHHYGIDLHPAKTDAKLMLMKTALPAFEDAIGQLEQNLAQPGLI